MLEKKKTSQLPGQSGQEPMGGWGGRKVMDNQRIDGMCSQEAETINMPRDW